MQSVQNLGLALISMLGGLIVDAKGYFLLEIFYLLWLCCKFYCHCFCVKSNTWEFIIQGVSIVPHGFYLLFSQQVFD